MVYRLVVTMLVSKHEARKEEVEYPVPPSEIGYEIQQRLPPFYVTVILILTLELLFPLLK
jgi:hypothetical protein